MTILYRVLPYLPGARRGQPGHPAFAPPSTGGNRIDNPSLYQTFYLGDSAAGAIAEAFGTLGRWGPGLFRGTPSLPGSVRALVSYELPAAVELCDLDDARQLDKLGLRPSAVVTRDRTITQAWAAKIYRQQRCAGVRWWSYYDPRWGSLGLWNTDRLRVTQVRVMDDIADPDLVLAADVLCRVITKT